MLYSKDEKVLRNAQTFSCKAWMKRSCTIRKDYAIKQGWKSPVQRSCNFYKDYAMEQRKEDPVQCAMIMLSTKDETDSPVQCAEYAMQQKWRSCTFRKDHAIKGGWEKVLHNAQRLRNKERWKCLEQCRKERILKKGYDIFLKVIQRTSMYIQL
jgi:hypothetical protein